MTEPANGSSPDFNSSILLIDDEELVLEVHKHYLQEAGFSNIRCHLDPVEAIEEVTSATPDLIITDLQMPNITGEFLIQLIRSKQRLSNVPIAAITSDTSDATREIIERSGANYVVYKPVEPETLVETVSQALLGQRQN